MTDRGALSPPEVAEYLGFDVSTVYRLMKSGEIPYVTIGRSRRTSRRALDELVDPSSARSQVLTDSHPTTGTGQ